MPSVELSLLAGIRSIPAPPQAAPSGGAHIQPGACSRGRTRTQGCGDPPRRGRDGKCPRTPSLDAFPAAHISTNLGTEGLSLAQHNIAAEACRKLRDFVVHGAVKRGPFCFDSPASPGTEVNSHNPKREKMLKLILKFSPNFGLSSCFGRNQ